MRNNFLFIILQKMRMPILVIIITYTIAIVGLVLIEGVDTNGNPYKMSIFDAFYFVSYTATTIDLEKFLILIHIHKEFG